MLRTESFKSGKQPRALFLGTTYAGHGPRFESLLQSVEADGRMDATFRRVTGWREGGMIEALRFLPRGLRGRARATVEASAFATLPRPDVLWTSTVELAAPFAWAQLGPLRRPLIVDLDATWGQLETMAPEYDRRPTAKGLRRRFRQLREEAIWPRVSLFTPWSTWAADGLRQAGVDDARIKVIPPGVDLGRWATSRRGPIREKLRLLFVGGDFERKGGDLLLEVMRGPIGDRFELDIVTRSQVAPTAGTRVHRLEPQDPRLIQLYQQADLFLLPSRAECFGIATIEAMASGLPVIVTPVGGSPDIVTEGSEGWFVEPDSLDSLSRRLSEILERPSALRDAGDRARRSAERKFNAAVRNAEILDTMLNLLTATASHPH